MKLAADLELMAASVETLAADRYADGRDKILRSTSAARLMRESAAELRRLTAALKAAPETCHTCGHVIALDVCAGCRQ